MTKPTAVIDKSLLEPICSFPDQTSSHCLRFLRENFTIYAPEILIEEVVTNYYDPNPEPRKTVAAKMLRAISDFHLMEHPLELVYREVVLGMDVRTGFDLNADATGNWRDWLSNLDSCLPQGKEFVKIRYAEKTDEVDKMKTFQENLRLTDPRNPDSPNPTCFEEFVQKTEIFLRMIFADPKRKQAFEKHLGASLNKWHPETVQRTEEALAKLSIDDLSRKTFTHDYTMVFLLYLWAPVARIGPQKSKPSNPIVLPGKKVNNEADAEYIVCALHCDYLLTCDKGMHKMAELHNLTCRFKHIGRNQRQAPAVIPS